MKTRNRTALLAKTKTVQAKRRLFSELDDTEDNLTVSVSSTVSNINTSPHKENTDPIACLQNKWQNFWLPINS